jgi:hypothetical protein
VIGCWFAPSSFTVDINLLDGMTHKLSLYFDDWDQRNRTEKVEILDALSGAVLDTRTITNFTSGVYLRWNVKGQIRVRLTNAGGPNVILNGLFFDSSARVAACQASGGIVAGNFQLQISGQDGTAVRDYASDDLIQWTKISSVTLHGSDLQFL